MTDTAPAAPAPTPADTPAPAGSEEQELLALHQNDPQTFEYAPYKDTGRTGAERLYDIRQARETASGEGTADEADDDGIEVDGIDLDAPITDIDAETGGDAGQDEDTGIKPLGPGDDATDEELAAWRAEHGVPDDPADYEAPAVEGVEWDYDALAPILQIAHDHNLPSKPIAEALTKYAERIKAQQVEIKDRDRENAKAVRAQFSDAEIAGIKSAAKAMPDDLREMLNTARLPDGTRLINQPDLLRLIASAYGTGNARQAAPRQDHRTAMQQELRDLDQLMTTDIDQYHRPWRGTGQSGSERRLALMRELASEAPAKPSAGDLRAEERELLRLRTVDPQMFSFGNWRGTGRPASDRLVAIQKGRG